MQYRYHEYEYNAALQYHSGIDDVHDGFTDCHCRLDKCLAERRNTVVVTEWVKASLLVNSYLLKVHYMSEHESSACHFV